MLQPILNNIASFIETNSGSFFTEVFPHVTIETKGENTYPAFWEPNAREGRPILADHRTNYGYIRENGEKSLAGITSVVGRGFTYTATVPLKLVIHYSIPDNGEVNNDVAFTFIQFLSGWFLTPGANSQVQSGFAQITSSNTNTLVVFAEETNVEPKLRHEDRLVSIDFDLVFRFTSMTQCVESDLCLGDLGTLNQISTAPLNVTSFGNAGCSHTVTKAEANALKVAGTVAPACVYFISDTGIYLLGVTTTEFSIDGWLLSGGDVDHIKYDWDNDNIFERSDKFNNSVRYSKAYIDLFGNPLASFPFNDPRYQGNTVIDSSFLHSGFSGVIFLGNRLEALSTLDITASSGTIQLNTFTTFTTATFSGTGNIQTVDANQSIITNTTSSITNMSCDQGTFSNTQIGTLANIAVLSGSSFTVTGGTGNYDGVRLEQSSSFISQSSANVTGYFLVNSASNIVSNTGILNNIFVSDSLFDLNGNDTGTPSLSNFNTTGNSLFSIEDNDTVLSNWTVSGRTVTLDVGSDTYIYEATTFISEILSNVTVQKPVSALGVIDLVTQTNDFIGIIEITASPVALTKIDLPVSWPERGRIRMFSDSGSSPVAINKTAPAVAAAGQFVASQNHSIVYHSAIVQDYFELEVINGICNELNVINFV